MVVFSVTGDGENLMSDQNVRTLAPIGPDRITEAQPGSPKKQSKLSPYLRRRARMSPAQIAAFNARLAFNARERRKRNPERIRALERAKYWSGIARDPEGYRAKRRAPDSGYDPSTYKPGVHVELVF
jgi:hypothetical protein